MTYLTYTTSSAVYRISVEKGREGRIHGLVQKTDSDRVIGSYAWSRDRGKWAEWNPMRGRTFPHGLREFLEQTLPRKRAP